jgi:lipopolysaccharide transport system permease protein
MSTAAVSTVPVERVSVAESTAAVRVFGARRGWRALDVAELWEFRELLYFLIWRDVKVRYKQTALGALWAVLQPAMYMVLFTLVFGRLAHLPSDGVPYPVFVFAGLLPWTFVANAVTNAGTSLVNNANLITKVYFPRFVVPLGSVGAALVDLGVGIVLLLGLQLYYRVPLTWSMLLLPAVLVMALVTAVACGALLSALTVAYRDFRYVVPFGVQVWMYATPVVYPASLVPERWRAFLWLNPMAGVVDGFRALALGRQVHWMLIAASGVTGALWFIGAVLYFARVERRFVDVV